MTSAIESLIKHYQDNYYAGTPVISDAEYDAIIKYHDAEKAIGPTGDVPHVYPMWSLQKIYLSRGDKIPTSCSGLAMVHTKKLDGNAVSIVYVDGKFYSATTRGDGTKGQDVTDKVKLLQIPHTIPVKGVYQITGEVVATSASANSRNIVSGKLVSEKDLIKAKEVFEEHQVVFAAYGVKPYLTSTYSGDMTILDDWGFDSITQNYFRGAPTDGEVYRADSNAKFDELGYTSKFPRGAYAVKEDEPPVETTLLDVIWQVGASGKVTPVAILESVDVKGTTISRATLNNISFIEALELEIGCKVALIRSGDIIPKIVAKVE